MTAQDTPTNVRPSFVRRMAIGLGYVVAILAFAEIAARLGALGPDPADVPPTVADGPYGVHDEELGWTACPHSEVLETGAYGMRGSQPPQERPEGSTVIACVGDENTWGELVDPEDVWPNRVTTALRRRGFDAHHVNAASVGYSSHQNVRLNRLVVAPRRPDALVLFLTTRNDRTDGAAISDSDWWQRRDRLRTSPLGFSRLARAASRAWYDGWKTPYRRSGIPRVSPEALGANIRIMVREAGTKTLAVLPPLPSGDPWLVAMRSALAEAGASTLEAPPFEDGNGSWLTGAGAPKLSRAGHGLLGQRVAERLTKLLGERPSPRDERCELTSAEPATVRFARRPPVTLRGRDVSLVRRLYVGEARIESFRIDGDALVFEVPRWLSLHPGRHRIVAYTEQGRTGGSLELVTARPVIRWRPVAEGPTAGTFTSFAPAYSKVSFWFSADRREEPLATPWGRFELAGGPDADRVHEPDVWTGLSLLELVAYADRNGALNVAVPRPPADGPPAPKRGWVQSLVRWGPRPGDQTLGQIIEVIND